ncbi:MAG: nucleotidyltransferase [Verrucomicrobia bacterium]|nr:MAG: nucleotidyltransferase [Verrucomicrobiota bacterium]
MHSPTLLVLAAGMGSRYGGLKQMDPMGPAGETVLDYSVYDAIRAGFERVVFIIREDFADAFRQGVGARFAQRIAVDYVFQSLDDLPNGFKVPEGRSKPWGTSHAVRAARHQVSGPFAVINADDFYGQDAYVRAAAFLRQSQSNNHGEISHYAMVGYPLINTLSDHGDVNRGICSMDGDGLLTAVEEYVRIERESDGIVRGQALDGQRRAVHESAPVSMNFWAFQADFFTHLEGEFCQFLEASGNAEKSECYIPTVVDSLIRQNVADCRVLSTDSRWFGVTYPEDKPHVVASIEKLTTEGVYPSPLV